MRIFVIESNDEAAKVLCAAINHLIVEDHLIEAISSPNSALCKLRNELPLPDLIIANFEGTEQARNSWFYRILRREFPRIPMILLGTNKEPEGTNSADFPLPYPFDRSEFAEAMREIFPHCTLGG